MISKNKVAILLIVAILITAVVVGFGTYTFSTYFAVVNDNRVLMTKDEYTALKTYREKYEKFENLINIANTEFLYEADEEKMMTGALKGMLSALDDPYTEYLTAEELAALYETTSGTYEGIGVYITASDDNKIMVVSPIEDTPAEKAGLKTGDKIIKINDVEYPSDKMDAAIKVMKGAPNTSVKLTILRTTDDKQETFDVDVMREKIKIQTVKSSTLEDNIGYIRITTFDEQTASDFKTHLKKLQNTNIKALVIDLRYNPGGLVNAAHEITDMLIGEGIVTYTKTKAGVINEYPSDANKLDIPYVLLVNEGSASASEIMAGAVKDTKSGTLIGTKTFGKGIVQNIRPFGNDGAGIKMTVSEYFTPNDINIHGIGIEPDITLELNKDATGYGFEYYDEDNQLQKAVEFLKEKMSSN